VKKVKHPIVKFAVLLLLLACCPLAAQNHSVTLTWTWSQGTGDPAVGFHIQRASVSGGPYVVIGTVNSPATLTYVDTGVVAGQQYYYVVTAFNAGGDSTPSNQIACVIPFQAPTTPTGLSGAVK
jgi:fibronectin type III domain protein